MGLLYGVLGIFAAFGSWGSRHRLNLVPVSWWIAIAAGAVFTVGVVHIREDAHNGELPQTMSVSALLDANPPVDSYVSVRGLVAPEAALTEREGERAVAAWIPMVDVAGKRILLVHAPRTTQYGDRSVDMAVTGMLREMNEELRRHLREQPIDRGFRPEVAYVLMPGERPRSAAFGLALCALTGIPLLVFLAAFLRGYVVFQPAGRLQACSALDESEAVDMRATGSFEMAAHRERFLEVHSLLGELENGQAAIFANVDASTSFMGLPTEDRCGWWSIPLSQVRDLEAGFLYLGWSRRPAIRFQTAEQSVVLSFASERQRGWAYGHLSSPGH